jgi:DNA-binding CsgD family transcriptional regulator
MSSATVTAAGIAFVSLAYNIASLSQLLFSGCVFTGLGAGLLILCWRDSSSDIGSTKLRHLLVALSLVISIMLYLLVVSLPFFIALCVCTLSPICSALLFIVANNRPAMPHPSQSQESPSCRPGEPQRPQPQHSQTKLHHLGKPKAVEPLLASLMTFCLVFSLAQGLFRSGNLAVGTQLAWTLVISSVVLAISGFVALEILWLRRRPKGLGALMFLPVVTAASLALAMLTSQTSLASSFFLFAGNFLLIIILYSEIDTVSFYARHPSRSFALGVIAADVGCMLGIVVGNLLSWAVHLWYIGGIYAVVSIAACLLHQLVKPRFCGRHPLSGTVDLDKDNLSVAPLLSFSPTNQELGRQSEYFGSDSVQAHKPDLDSQIKAISMLDNITRLSRLAAQSFALSVREEEILCYLVRGKSAKSIAAAAYISYNTVKTHISHVYQKLGVHTREELMQLVEGIEDLPENQYGYVEDED